MHRGSMNADVFKKVASRITRSDRHTRNIRVIDGRRELQGAKTPALRTYNCDGRISIHGIMSGSREHAYIKMAAARMFMACLKRKV